MKKYTKLFLIASIYALLPACGSEKVEEPEKEVVTEDAKDPMLLNQELFFEDKFFVETYNHVFFDSLERQVVEEMLFELTISRDKVSEMGEEYADFRAFKEAELAYMDYMLDKVNIVADKVGYGDVKWAQAYIETMDSLEFYATARDNAQEVFITKFHKGKEKSE